MDDNIYDDLYDDCENNNKSLHVEYNDFMMIIVMILIVIMTMIFNNDHDVLFWLLNLYIILIKVVIW